MARWGTDAELEVLVQLNALTVSSSTALCFFFVYTSVYLDLILVKLVSKLKHWQRLMVHPGILELLEVAG